MYVTLFMHAPMIHSARCRPHLRGSIQALILACAHSRSPHDLQTIPLELHKLILSCQHLTALQVLCSLRRRHGPPLQSCFTTCGRTGSHERLSRKS